MKIPRVDIINISDRRRTDTRVRRAIAATALAAAVGVSALVYADQAGPPQASSTSAAAARTVGAGVDSYAEVVQRTSPAVVTVRSVRRGEARQAGPFTSDPFFRRFFGEEGLPGPPQGRRERGLGSGVIVRGDGYILTNHHVVEHAETITVETSDRRSFPATVVGSDPPTDLAVLKIDAGGLPALSLGDSDEVRVGDVVLALGNPMGVGQTVTMGIISAKGRATGLGEGSYEDFLQTDAPINQGNSGGALVNTRGELIGINSQILSPSGGNIGIGFAIPANLARSVMDALIAGGSVRRGMIGVTVQSLTPELARSLRLEAPTGALVSSVQEDGPAARGGVQQGDVIVALNGKPMVESNALRNQVSQFTPGTTVELRVLRDGSERDLSVVLGEVPAPAATRRGSDGDEPGSDAAGLAVRPLTPELAQQLNIDATRGLVVTSVDPAGPAADAGFQRGDVIEEVDGQPVATVDGLREALRSAGDRPALVLVNRDGASTYLALARS